MIITQAQDWAVNYNDSTAMPYKNLLTKAQNKLIVIVAVFGAKPKLLLNLYLLQSNYFYNRRRQN